MDLNDFFAGKSKLFLIQRLKKTGKKQNTPPLVKKLR